MIGVRALYQRSLDPEGKFVVDETYGEIRRRIGDRGADKAATALDELVAVCTEWSAAETVKFRALTTTPAVIRFLLRNCAPLGLMAGAWLQWLPAAANADTDLFLQIINLYAEDVGVGAPRASRGNVYRSVLREHQALPPSHQYSDRLAASEDILTTSFALAGQLLMLSRYPHEALPEILGADLCLRAAGLLPPLATIPGLESNADLNPGRSRGGEAESSVDRSLRIATHLLREQPDIADRVRNGFRWTLAELQDWTESLLLEVQLASDPSYDMWRLIWSTAPNAAVYHGTASLNGVCLRDHFMQVDAGPETMLPALAASKLVRPGEPDRSTIIRGLIAPRGPMFRVFSESDVDIIRRWILSLPDSRSDQERQSYYRALHRAQQHWYRHRDSPSAVTTAVLPPPKVSVREAYHRLLTRNDSGQMYEYAIRYTERWLSRTRFQRTRGEVDELPSAWNRAQGLRPWLTRQHTRHAEQFQDSDQPLPSREALIESTIQTAPLTLIDGAWIQGYTDYGLASTDSGHFLFQTYWDELGNGQIALNHPKIYRDLLRDMEIELPPTSSEEFAGWSGFDDESFLLPVYWLCISRFPNTFRPEVLGLNLAMELSGVGGGYRRTSLALEKYGFDTLFVDLHNTIDNVSTGHSAWAADAIDSYMCSIADTMGERALVRNWDRIRVGYRSLRPPSGGLPSVFARIGTAMSGLRPLRSPTTRS